MSAESKLSNAGASARAAVCAGGFAGAGCCAASGVTNRVSSKSVETKRKRRKVPRGKLIFIFEPLAESRYSVSIPECPVTMNKLPARLVSYV